MKSKSDIRHFFQQLEPDEFESFVASVWSAMGWSTKVTSHTQDQGIDVVATKSGIISKKSLIQVKCYSYNNKVGSPEIRQYNSLKQQENNVDSVVIVTSSSFTSDALFLSEKLNVKCVDGTDLAETTLSNISDDKLSHLFEQNKSNTRSFPTTSQNLSVENLSSSELNLVEVYSKYLKRANIDSDKIRTKRSLYFHLDGEYNKTKTYDSSLPSGNKDMYAVEWQSHKIQFQSESPELWLRFQKTANKYGWEIVESRALGETDLGFRGIVPPEKADKFILSICTGNQDNINPTKQARISNLVLDKIFNRSLSGMRVTDGASGLNPNRHSNVIK